MLPVQVDNAFAVPRGDSSEIKLADEQEMQSSKVHKSLRALKKRVCDELSSCRYAQHDSQAHFHIASPVLNGSPIKNSCII